MSVEQASVVVAARRRVQLMAALVLDVVAFALALAALGGGVLSAVAPVIGVLVTGTALALSRQSWAGAGQVWSGREDPAQLRGLVRRSLWPSLPVLLVSFGVTIAVAVRPASRLFSSSPTTGNASWTDGVLLLSLLFYVLASAGAALYPLRVRR